MAAVTARAMNVSHCDRRRTPPTRVKAGFDKRRKTSAAAAPVPAGPVSPPSL